MSTVGDIRQGLADAITGNTGLRCWPLVPDNPTPPFALVAPSRVTYHRAFAGHSTFEFVVSVVVGRVSERAAQLTLDEFIDTDGDRSIRQAIESDKTLGGACKTLVVTEMTDYSPLSIGEAVYLSAQFTVQVQQ